PDDVRIRRRNGERSDGGDRLAVEDRFPGVAAVTRLENSAGGGAGVVDERVAWHAGDGDDAIPVRTDVAPRELAVNVGTRAVVRLRLPGRQVSRDGSDGHGEARRKCSPRRSRRARHAWTSRSGPRWSLEPVHERELKPPRGQLVELPEIVRVVKLVVADGVLNVRARVEQIVDVHRRLELVAPQLELSSDLEL